MNDTVSFGHKLKSELSAMDKLSINEKTSLLYGLSLFSRSFGRDAIGMQTEYECVALVYETLFGQICGVSLRKRVLGGESPLYSLSVAAEEDRLAVLRFFSHEPGEISLKINMASLESPEERRAFVRGVFLACGYASNPGKAYRLEFVVPRFKLCKNLDYLLTAEEYTPKSTVRKASHILYFRDSAVIEDLITFMGATRSTLELMDVKLYKDLRNNINRKTNCETANIEKTVTASSAQIRAIRTLKRTGGFKNLPHELAQIAALRLKYPESSLSELGAMLSPTITRSGVSHRLRKLVKLANERTIMKRTQARSSPGRQKASRLQSN